jgi:hypothetical protein
MIEESTESFNADKYIKIGRFSLVDDVEMKLLYCEDKAFRIIMSGFLISLLIVVLNFFW